MSLLPHYCPYCNAVATRNMVGAVIKDVAFACGTSSLHGQSGECRDRVQSRVRAVAAALPEVCPFCQAPAGPTQDDAPGEARFECGWRRLRNSGATWPRTELCKTREELAKARTQNMDLEDALRTVREQKDQIRAAAAGLYLALQNVQRHKGLLAGELAAIARYDALISKERLS